MSDTQGELTDVSDMYGVHEAFRRGLRDAPAQAEASIGEPERAQRFVNYLLDLLALLHAHHEGEDEVLYPLLVERVPEQRALFAEMDAQHQGVTSSLESCTAAARAFGASATRGDAESLASACDTLGSILESHLGDEEVQILPIAAVWVTPEEWGRLPAHAMMSYRGDRLWMLFGLATEAMAPAVLADIVEHLPPPLADMWLGFGADAFASEMAAIRIPT